MGEGLGGLLTPVLWDVDHAWFSFTACKRAWDFAFMNWRASLHIPNVLRSLSTQWSSV